MLYRPRRRLAQERLQMALARQRKVLYIHAQRIVSAEFNASKGGLKKQEYVHRAFCGQTRRRMCKTYPQREELPCF
jgi:hypothetical protein